MTNEIENDDMNDMADDNDYDDDEDDVVDNSLWQSSDAREIRQSLLCSINT